MELRRIWQLIWRRKWIIIQTFLVVSLTVIIGARFLTPVYETSAKLLIKASEPRSALLSGVGLSGIATLSSAQETEMETYVALVAVDPVLEKVISRLQLRTRRGDLMKPRELTKSKFIVSSIFPEPYAELEQIEDADLIEVTARSSDPEEAAMIANTVAEAYIEEDLRQRKEEYKKARIFIEEQIEMSRAEYLKVLAEVRRFKIEEETVDLETETQVAISKMADLMKEKEQTIISLAGNRARMETLKAQLEKQTGTAVSSSAMSENPQIQMLKSTLGALELELAEGLTEKTPEHPDVVILNQKIKKAKSELGKEISVLQESSAELQSTEREIATLESHLKGVDVDIEKCSSVLYAIPDKAFAQSPLLLKLSSCQVLYSSLLENLRQFGIAEAMAVSDIRLAETAAEPDIDKPKSPDKVINAVVGTFLGLVFGFGLAFMLEYLDDTIGTPDQVKEQGLTLLGTVQNFRRGKGLLISQRDPKDPVSEAYRTARNSLKFAARDKPANSLLIVSSLAQEGRTTTVVNLGLSIAREGKEVLLMDTDLRKPGVHDLFGMSNSIGITTILSGEANSNDAVQETGIQGLSLLTSGPVPPDPASLVESVKMKQLIEDLAQKYAAVILDSSPILVADDAIVIAGYVDSSIFILESEKTTKGSLSRARELLAQAHIQPIGAILNKFRQEKAGIVPAITTQMSE